MTPKSEMFRCQTRNKIPQIYPFKQVQNIDLLRSLSGVRLDWADKETIGETCHMLIGPISVGDNPIRIIQLIQLVFPLIDR